MCSSVHRLAIVARLGTYFGRDPIVYISMSLRPEMSKISPSLCDSNFASEGIPGPLDPSTSKRLWQELEHNSEMTQWCINQSYFDQKRRATRLVATFLVSHLGEFPCILIRPHPMDPHGNRNIIQRGPNDVYVKLTSTRNAQELDFVYTIIFNLRFVSEGIHLPVDPSTSNGSARES